MNHHTLQQSEQHVLGELQSPTCEQSFAHAANTLKPFGFSHIPIVRETLADLDTPVSTYLKLANKSFSYLFESVQGGNKWGRYSIIGMPCEDTHTFCGRTYQHHRNTELLKSVDDVDPFEEIRKLQSKYKVATFDGLPEMIGGLVGYFGYETIAYIENKLDLKAKHDPLGCPDIVLMVSKDVVVFDNLSGRIYFVSLADINEPDAFANAQARLDGYLDKLSSSFTHPVSNVVNDSGDDAEYETHFARPDFEDAVQTCRDYIKNGDIMQVVLSQRLSAPFHSKAIDLYRALRTINPSPYMYYMNLGDFDIVGSSPEILVRLDKANNDNANSKVTVRPIAGTRKRGNSEEQDRAMENELLNDEKELAEHIMLIDLGRNDVGRIAKTGSVELTEKMVIERYSHVMHIVSNVDAVVKDNMDAIDVLKATFPAGTVSGAPKVRAMEIIHELEPIKRGVYSGAIGYIGWSGNMDTAIAIRTAVVKDNRVNIQAGAGIVADSIPKYEWKETQNKARAMLKAVEMANRGLRINDSNENTNKGGA